MKYCKSCGHLLRLVKKRNLKHPDIKKMIKLMEKYNLSQADIIKTLGITKQTLMRWLSSDINQKIKPIHFEVLEMKGYK